MAVQVAILGFAHGHVNTYCKEWKDHPEYGITAVAGWDHDVERGERQSVAFCPSLDELLARTDIQAVIIGSETSLHADMVERAAKAGKAIVLQKPIALTLAEADRIVNAVNTYAVPFTMAWQMRVDPQNNEIIDLLRQGDLGKVLSVRRRHALSTHTWAGFEDSWHTNPKYTRDIWADDAAHPIDWIYSIFGAPQSITAEIVTLLNPKIENDNGIAILRYPDGPLVEICCSFTCTAAISTTEIICEKGTIIQNFGDSPSSSAPRTESSYGLKWYQTEGNTWTVSKILSPDNQGKRIAGLAKPLADFLNGKRLPISTAEDGRESLRIVLATYVSSREGRRVTLDDPAILEV